ncbi:uncharacterized protein LOC116350885 [Contarinia nasturtii]|uniref:uncharacterized protein LOC116350885 n=1 Tax=Contarinia nasturtii TaxID=265458 RepID=UPI0012D45322|nr:uncharacterized protein LOC116350885 [Contarinia nasturtii]
MIFLRVALIVLLAVVILANPEKDKKKSTKVTKAAKPDRKVNAEVPPTTIDDDGLGKYGGWSDFYSDAVETSQQQTMLLDAVEVDESHDTKKRKKSDVATKTQRKQWRV